MKVPRLALALAAAGLLLGTGRPARSADAPTAPLDAPNATAAREAARWIARQALPTADGRGVAFPEYAEEPEGRGPFLYDGSAGVLVFLEHAARLLNDPALARLADRTAAGLLAAARRDVAGRPTWAAAGGGATAGLYTGDAGVAVAFLVRARARDDAAALETARSIADGLLARARTEDGATSWDAHLDVIAGAAGAALAFIDLATATGEARYGQAALAIARHLLKSGESDPAPGAREPQTRWPAGLGDALRYPNFSHGTAGVAYALARVAALTGDGACRDGAVAGGRWLLAHAKAEDGTLCWPHDDGKGAGRFMEGWCHGPAGSARLFLVLSGLTGEPSWMEAGRKSAAWIRRQRPLPAPEGRPTRFYSPSLCCGAAGVLDFFVDLYGVTRDPADRAYALEVASYLRALSKPEGDGRRWTNYDAPDEKGVIYHGTSLMLGAAGEALALLRAAAIDRAPDPVAWLPDRAVALPRAGDAPPFAPPPRGPGAAPPAPEAPPGPSGPVAVARVPELSHGGDAYVVLTNRSKAGDPYSEAAKALAAWRKGTVVADFDPARPEAVLDRLRSLGARHVALVLPPEHIDTNLQRRFLMAAARLDDDPFTDVAWGYITGTARTKPQALVDRARALARKGIERRWVGLSVASEVTSFVSPSAGDPTAQRAGWEGRSVYFGIRESDPAVLEFVAREVRAVEPGGVLSFTGNGDPEGIWLFSDLRNADPAKHRPFDPKKVGLDPSGEMPRVLASHLAHLRADGAVVWSGVCHTGSLDRVFVESDIVSTFGTVDAPTEYRIPAGRSVGGAILDSGAAAYLAPLGPNHGYRCIVEAQEALEGRLSLGDVLRSTWDDVAMAQDGAPAYDLYVPGGPPVDRAPGMVMGGGGANRVLYGDPALEPFAKETVEACRAVETTPPPRPGAPFDVRVAMRAKDWGAWDMFWKDGSAERIRAVVDLAPGTAGSLEVTADLYDPKGTPVTVARVVALVEAIDGRLRLHLQASGPRGHGLGEPGSRAVFRVRPLPATTR